MATPMHEIPGRRSNYDKWPSVAAGPPAACAVGWTEVCERIARSGARVVAVEADPCVRPEDLHSLARHLAPDRVYDTTQAMRRPEDIERLVAPELTDDPVFGRITRLALEDFFDPGALDALRARIAADAGRVVVHGPGAALAAPEAFVVWAGMPRWEGQLRQRRGEVSNLGADNVGAEPSLQYKRSFFVDRRVCDRHRQRIWEDIDAFLDTTQTGLPKLVSAGDLSRALRETVRGPFRVVPFFDPAPWGGHWIERVCDVRHDGPNIGWCFDCVPEENSLLLGFGDRRFEIPAIDLVYRQAPALLGDAVYGRFGEDFPIRFDFLDTMGGGNLSLQVHPPTTYIQETFGMPYTQDESYYLLDAGPDAGVYLGVREGIDPDEMLADLRRADADPEFTFPAERYVNRFPVARHDHILLPAGTVHCSGVDAMVLEISATPYLFTFKLWDWGRLGLDGRPRPTHIDHGERSIRWERDTTFAKTELMNRIEAVAGGEGWMEERTGLHPTEFIETRRHRFRVPVRHEGHEGVQVLNLVDGEEAVVESPDEAFEPFVVHYAETFIVPAAAGPYTIRPVAPGEGCATIKAYVRTGP